EGRPAAPRLPQRRDRAHRRGRAAVRAAQRAALAHAPQEPPVGERPAAEEAAETYCGETLQGVPIGLPFASRSTKVSVPSRFCSTVPNPHRPPAPPRPTTVDRPLQVETS